MACVLGKSQSFQFIDIVWLPGGRGVCHYKSVLPAQPRLLWSEGERQVRSRRSLRTFSEIKRSIRPQSSPREVTLYIEYECSPGVRGGGGVLTLWVWQLHLESTVLLAGHGQPLVLPSPNLQPPLSMEAQGQPIQIVTFWWIYLFIGFNLNKLFVFRTLLNAYICFLM